MAVIHAKGVKPLNQTTGVVLKFASIWLASVFYTLRGAEFHYDAVSACVMYYLSTPRHLCSFFCMDMFLFNLGLAVIGEFNCLSIDTLEQLDHLRSEIAPAAPWLPIIGIHIRSQANTRQSYKLKKNAKN